ncbi:hypothetical protein ACHAXR_010754 [Thalassiosira sp. AJA248-18]
MTAISPYAPLRRQSSILSSSSNNGRVLRRSSSTGAIVVANGGAATLLWMFLRFWKVNNDDDDGAPSSNNCHVREWLDSMADMVSSNLTMHDPLHNMNSSENRSAELSTNPSPRRCRGSISAVLCWLVAFVGGDQSKMGRIVVLLVSFAREVLLRSIGAANIVLTGASTPTLSRCKSENNTIRIENSLTDLYKPVSRGAGIPTTTGEMNFDTIRRERLQIDQVLTYWFGQASPDGAQKSLWMIASSSVELLNQVDKDISDKFRSLVLDLSSNCPGDDDNVEGTSQHNKKGKIQSWTENVDIFGWQGKIAAIIALDQMSRHIHRNDKKHQDKSIQFIPKQQELDSIAYDTAKKLQNQHHEELSTGMIPLPMRIFGIMPLRHASTVQDLGIVQQDVESASALHDEMDRMIRRFRKATNRRMAALQDEARRKGKLGLIEKDVKGGNRETENQQFDDEKILECFPFKADMSNAHDHMVIKTMSSFLSKMNILQMSDDRFKSSRKTANSLRNKSPPITNSDQVPTAIVSLSGGVDSMVIASALAYLRDTEAGRQNTRPDNILRIVAIHIDYANRPESRAEASYVGRYCQGLGAKFVCRKIDEVTRGVTARDDYERIAREIRFGLYRQCSAEASDGTKEGGVGIMLGHHRGDLRENVISNAHKGCGPLDLSGMTSISRNDGVTLFRPLLSLEKTYIHDYSHTFGVPYFKDTTPHWSTRGKLRNRLLPLLEEIYGEGSMVNLSSLAEESDDAKALIQQTVMSPFMEKVKRHPMGISIETSPWKDCGLFFWKFVLRQVLHSTGLGMFSDKSVESFLDRIQASNLKQGWLQCRKDYAVFLQKDGRVFVFDPISFPFGNGQKNGQYVQDSTFLGYGSENSMKVGPWTIISEAGKATSEKEATLLLQTKAVQNMEQLMAGDIQYYMKVPIVSEASRPQPLIRVKGFTKSTRPAAWKGFDLKVECTLPLLGVDQSVLANEATSGPQEFGKTWTIAKVHLLLNLKKADARTMDAKVEDTVRAPQDVTNYDVIDSNDAYDDSGAHAIASNGVSGCQHANESQASKDKMGGYVIGLLNELSFGNGSG